MTTRPFLLSVIVLASAIALSGCAGMVQSVPQLSGASNDKSVQIKSAVSTVIDTRFSHRGDLLISGGTSPTLREWSVANATEARKLRIPIKGDSTEQLMGARYSPDDSMIAIGYRTGIFCCDVGQLLDAKSGQVLSTFPMSRDLAFSPDGALLVGAEVNATSRVVKIYDVRGHKVVGQFTDYQHVAVAPIGQFLIMALKNPVKGELVAYDYGQKREIWRQKFGRRVTALSISPDGNTLVVGSAEEGPLKGVDIYLDLYDAQTGRHMREVDHTSLVLGLFDSARLYSSISRITFSPDGRSVLAANNLGQYRLWDAKSGKLLHEFKRTDEKIVFGFSAGSGSFSPSGKVLALSSAASVRLYDVSTGNEIAALLAFDDGEWLITTPSGYYNSSEKGDEYLDVSVEGKPYSTSQLREAFFRPDLVKIALGGDTLSGFKRVADIKPPPTVQFVETQGSVTVDQVVISLQVKDQGGGIGDVRLYRNGTAVVLERTRNLQVVADGAGSQVLRYSIRLEHGANEIRAIAFNADNSMQSSDAITSINASIVARPPALHAVVVGIKDFANPRLALAYPVADAELFAGALEVGGKGLFDTVDVRRLLKPDETTKAAITEALKRAQKEVGPEDLFVFYVASHGTVDDGQYFLITSNVGSTSTARLKQDALSQDSLKELISNMPASKKLVVLDTCNAGHLGDAIQVAMLTRGMSDDAAMKMLSRAVGSTVMSAATSIQEALEGYKGHGLFTYVIAEGLKGAADANKDGFVKTLELADYVDTQVPELAEMVFKHKQYPIVSPTGQGFPLVKIR